MLRRRDARPHGPLIAGATIPGQTAPLAPPHLFENGQFGGMLDKLKEQFDYVVFDTAPLRSYLDAIFLASLVDGVVLVVKAESTLVEVGKEIKARLHKVGAPILGVVVNQAEDYIPRFIRQRLRPEE